MQKPNMSTANEDIDISSVLATLDEEEIGNEVPEAVTAEEIEELELDAVEEIDETTDLDPEDADKVESALAIAEVYAENAAEETVDEEPAAATGKPAKKVRAASTGPKTVRNIADLDPKHFVLTTDEPDDLVANKTAVIARRPAQVKVAEKFDNVLSAVAAEKKPSAYTMDGFKALLAAGTITSGEMVKALVGAGHAESTARSQAGQMMALFPALMIAERDGKSIKLNDKSLLAEALKILAAS